VALLRYLYLVKEALKKLVLEIGKALQLAVSFGGLVFSDTSESS
jgi:hypothetical protein